MVGVRVNVTVIAGEIFVVCLAVIIGMGVSEGGSGVGLRVSRTG
jgi:hypothetical protein